MGLKEKKIRVTTVFKRVPIKLRSFAFETWIFSYSAGQNTIKKYQILMLVLIFLHFLTTLPLYSLMMIEWTAAI